MNKLFEKLEIWYDNFIWNNSKERLTLVHNRLRAHELAMKEGRNSPYTHPEDYPDWFYQEITTEG